MCRARKSRPTATHSPSTRSAGPNIDERSHPARAEPHRLWIGVGVGVLGRVPARGVERRYAGADRPIHLPRLSVLFAELAEVVAADTEGRDGAHAAPLLI